MQYLNSAETEVGKISTPDLYVLKPTLKKIICRDSFNYNNFNFPLRINSRSILILKQKQNRSTTLMLFIK
jgi:hypothetical protein